MNPLQLEQIVPLVQASENLEIKPLKTGDESFANALKIAQDEVQKNDDVRSAEVSKEDFRNGEKVEEKSEKTETSDEKKEIAQNKSSEDKKESEIAKSEPEDAEELAQNAALQGIQNAENQLQFVARRDITVSEDGINAVANAKSTEETDNIVSDKMLAWLLSSEKTEESVEMDTDFAALIDAAVDFIPGAETDAEKLQTAQNLAISDPENFLQQVHQLADAEISQNESILNERFSFDKFDKAEVSELKSKKSDSKLTVHDLRTYKGSETLAENAKVVQKAAAKREMNLTYQQKNDSTMQVTMELANNAEANILSNNSQSAGATGSNFQQMLTNAVVENAPEFVKAGNVVLKDGNQGTINLILRPEKLGNVKISLNLNDKIISGQISVQSKEALDAFRESIDSLKQAFTESGFETGSFDLNFSNQQSFAQGGNESQNQQANFMAERTYGDFVSSKEISSGNAESAYSDGSSYGVNIVA